MVDLLCKEFLLVLHRLFYIGAIPVKGYQCPQPTSIVELFGSSQVTGYQPQVQVALRYSFPVSMGSFSSFQTNRESNFNVSAYAIHYLPTYMEFYLLFIQLEDLPPAKCPY